MIDLGGDLFVAAAFLTPWGLDVFRAATPVRVLCALFILALGCLLFFGGLHFEVPRVWGRPLAIVLQIAGMIGAVRMFIHSGVVVRDAKSPH